MKTRLSSEDDNQLTLNMVETIHHHKQPPHVHGGGHGDGGEAGHEGSGSGSRLGFSGTTMTTTTTTMATMSKTKRTYWALMCASGAALVMGLSAASLLGRLYFVNGGSRRWLYTWVQSAAWPLLLPLLLTFSSSYRLGGSDRFGGSDRSRSSSSSSSSPSSSSSSSSSSSASSASASASASSALSLRRSFVIAIAIAGLGGLTAIDNLLYSYGASYLPVSTNSLLCASQLAFNAAFSAALVRQRLSAFTLNAIVLITMATLLVAMSTAQREQQAEGGGDGDGDGDGMKTTRSSSSSSYVVGIVATVMASAIFALILPLTELIYRDLVGRGSFARVIEVQIGVSAVASAIALMGMWAAGDFSAMAIEAAAFGPRSPGSLSGRTLSGGALSGNLSGGTLSGGTLSGNLSGGPLSIGNLSGGTLSGNLSGATLAKTLSNGTLSYVGTLVACSVGWQLYVIGAAGIVFLASSLVSCVFMTAMIPILPALAVAAFSDPFSPLDALAMLLSLWGFLSYLYGGYLLRSRQAKQVSSLEHLPPA